MLFVPFSGAEAVTALQEGLQLTPEVSLEGLPELQQQRLLVGDLMLVFSGGVSEYLQVTSVDGRGGSRQVAYELSKHCDSCSAFVKDTVAKCALLHCGLCEICCEPCASHACSPCCVLCFHPAEQTGLGKLVSARACAIDTQTIVPNRAGSTVRKPMYLHICWGDPVVQPCLTTSSSVLISCSKGMRANGTGAVSS
jgi:hypothetical protein